MTRTDTTKTSVISSQRVRLAASEPKILKVIGEESKRKGTNLLTSRRIDQIIKSARLKRAKL